MMQFCMKNNHWTRLLAYVTGLVNQELLLQNEYLAAENRILRAHLPTRLRLTDPERSTFSGNRQTARPKSAARSGARRPTGYDSRLVPQADR